MKTIYAIATSSNVHPFKAWEQEYETFDEAVVKLKSAAEIYDTVPGNVIKWDGAHKFTMVTGPITPVLIFEVVQISYL